MRYRVGLAFAYPPTLTDLGMAVQFPRVASGLARNRPADPGRFDVDRSNGSGSVSPATCRLRRVSLGLRPMNHRRSGFSSTARPSKAGSGSSRSRRERSKSRTALAIVLEGLAGRCRPSSAPGRTFPRPITSFLVRGEADRRSGLSSAAATFPVGEVVHHLDQRRLGRQRDGAFPRQHQRVRRLRERVPPVREVSGTTPGIGFRVQVTDDVIRCWIATTRRPSPSITRASRSRPSRSDSRNHQPLGFASYRSTGAVRAVQVRKLTPSEVAETNKAGEG